jgi:hypothetical protein
MVHVPTNDGSWVNENFQRLAEVIRDYDPQFELRYIPPDKRSEPTDHSRAYCVFDLISQTPAFYAGHDATPETILTHLFDIDNKHGDVLARMEARNNATEALRLKEQMDIREEKKEYVQWLMKTRKNTINLKDRHGEKFKVDSQMRRIT